MANVSAEPSFHTETELSLHKIRSKRELILIFIALLDYIWVITIYATVAFILAVIIDGHILKQFDLEATKKVSTPKLAIQVIVQIAIQGFIAIILHGLLELLSSPIDGVYGYNSKGGVGNLLRSPAIISVILFALSRSLQGRLLVLFSRFDKNALEALKHH